MPPEFNLTRKQQNLFDYLLNNQDIYNNPPTLDELCTALGLKSRGSLHKHIQALIDAGLVEPLNNKKRGIRLTELALQATDFSLEKNGLKFVGLIAAGRPIHVFPEETYMAIPDQLKSDKPSYVLQVQGDSMIDEGIYDGDWIIIEQRSYARNGEIVVAIIENDEATLKFIEQYPHETILIPANKTMKPMRFKPEQIEIQGVLIGQMRSYLH